MNRIRIIHFIRRSAAALAVGAAAWLGLVTAAPAAFAQSALIPRVTGGDDAPSAVVPGATSIVVVGGMPGWEIALIAAGAAVFAAAAAVLTYRAIAARRPAAAATA
jgi:hypothetical protein